MGTKVTSRKIRRSFFVNDMGFPGAWSWTVQNRIALCGKRSAKPRSNEEPDF
jgi:hypothetical protein